MSPQTPLPLLSLSPGPGRRLGKGPAAVWTPAQAPVGGLRVTGTRLPKCGPPSRPRSCLVSGVGRAAPSRPGSTGCQGWEGLRARSPRFVGRNPRPRGLGEASGEKGYPGWAWKPPLPQLHPPAGPRQGGTTEPQCRGAVYHGDRSCTEGCVGSGERKQGTQLFPSPGKSLTTSPKWRKSELAGLGGSAGSSGWRSLLAARAGVPASCLSSGE